MFYILTFFFFFFLDLLYRLQTTTVQCPSGPFSFNNMSTGYQAVPQKVEFLTNLCFLENLDQKLDDL